MGFSGEASPRRVFKTVDAVARPAIDPYFHHTRADDVPSGDDLSLDDQDLLWDLNLSKGTSAQAIKDKDDLLLARLTVLLRTVYQEYLMTDPTQRKVILVENPLVPAAIRQHIYTVLFDNLKVPMVSPMSAPLLATFATGSSTALVVNAGVLETSIMPIYHGRPLLSHFRTSTRAGKRLHLRLKGLLLRYARYIEPESAQQNHSTSTPSQDSIASRTRRLSPDLLSADMLDRIIIKACFVQPRFDSDGHDARLRPPPLPTTQSLRDSSQPPDKTQTPDWQQPHTGDHDAIAEAQAKLDGYRDEHDSHVLPALRDSYAAADAGFGPTGHLLLPILPAMAAHIDRPILHDGIATLSSTSSTPTPFPFPASSTTPALAGVQKASASVAPSLRGSLLIPGWLRSRLADFFFEEDDSVLQEDCDSQSLPTMVLSTLLGLPIDVRRDLASSILITGGSAALPGFANRLKEECLAVLSQCARSAEQEINTKLRDIALNTTRVDVDVRPSRGDRSRRRTKQQVMYAPLAPLRSSIAVLNDHHPPLSSDGEPLSGDGTGQKSQRMASAPSIPPALYAWFGASLLGSLKITSMDTVRRDEWDAQREAERAEALAATAAEEENGPP